MDELDLEAKNLARFEEKDKLIAELRKNVEWLCETLKLYLPTANIGDRLLLLQVDKMLIAARAGQKEAIRG